MYINALDFSLKQNQPTEILQVLYLPILVFWSIMYFGDSVRWEKGITKLHHVKRSEESKNKDGNKKSEEEGMK